MTSHEFTKLEEQEQLSNFKRNAALASRAIAAFVQNPGFHKNTDQIIFIAVVYQIECVIGGKI